MEEIVRLEDGAETLEVKKLRKFFNGTQYWFSQLPEGSRMRTKVMESVNDQLGEKGERLRKAGKNDGEIFEEWLKQVFIPLYRRAAKK